MLKATTLRVFPPTLSWQECLKEAASAGYQGVEVNFDGRLNLDCPDNTLKAIKRLARETRIRITSVYSRQQWWTPEATHRDSFATGSESCPCHSRGGG